MNSRKSREWGQALEIHSSAVSIFADAAKAVPQDSWSSAHEVEKWTPAEVVEHLCLAYEVLLRELGGGTGMAIRVPFWQRWILRSFLVPGLLRGKPFPKGARAPRETRPLRVVEGQLEAVNRFRQLGRLFDEAVRRTYRENPKARLTHAYFGASNLPNAVLLCARHIKHHVRHLPAPEL